MVPLEFCVGDEMRMALLAFIADPDKLRLG
jgi:hypothetical protein